jgi:hypothetical protein
MNSKTYYFEEHVGFSDKKPVKGVVSAFHNDNKIFEGDNLVVDTGRVFLRDYMSS